MGIVKEYEIFLEEILSSHRIPSSNSITSKKADESPTNKRKKALEAEAFSLCMASWGTSKPLDEHDNLVANASHGALREAQMMEMAINAVLYGPLSSKRRLPVFEEIFPSKR